MTKAEQNAQAWYEPAIVIELEDGTILFPSKDEEGNGTGVLFGRERSGEDFALFTGRT